MPSSETLAGSSLGPTKNSSVPTRTPFRTYAQGQYGRYDKEGGLSHCSSVGETGIVHSCHVRRRGHLIFSDNSANLLPRARYLAMKRPTILPDLRQTTGSPDEGPWCPVRALTFYLDRTRAYRGEHDQMFLTLQKPYHPANKQTIARWILKTATLQNSLESLVHAQACPILSQGYCLHLDD